MRVFVINLERSADRRQAMSARLTNLGIEHTFFRAVDGACGEHLTAGRFRPGLAARYGGFLSPGEAACFASHARLWAECEALGEPITVLEDDVDLDDRFPEALRKAEVAIAGGAIFVRLCGLIQRPHVDVSDAGDGYRIVRYLKGPSGSQAYALTPEAGRRFAAEAQEWAEPVDDFVDRFWLHGVPSMAVLPYRASRAPVASTIGTRQRLSVGARWQRKVRRAIDTVRRTAHNSIA
ncbi:MAG: glycosyltransferase family 25 protein [Hyphomicrobiales bacterium]|nr:glycosyltransferase family 25 protein [Hyphomicrobiales bacterium]